MKKLQNSAAFFFIISVIVLAFISILGVCEVFGGDVITKSFETLGLLAGVAVIIMVAGRFVDGHIEAPVSASEAPLESPSEINPAFTGIRQTTVVILVFLVAILALLGVMSIWEVVAGDVLHKSLSSIGIAAFSSLIIIITCLEREKHKILHSKMSGGLIFVIIILGWAFLSSIFF